MGEDDPARRVGEANPNADRTLPLAVLLGDGRREVHQWDVGLAAAPVDVVAHRQAKGVARRRARGVTDDEPRPVPLLENRHHGAGALDTHIPEVGAGTGQSAQLDGLRERCHEVALLHPRRTAGVDRHLDVHRAVRLLGAGIPDQARREHREAQERGQGATPHQSSYRFAVAPLPIMNP